MVKVWFEHIILLCSFRRQKYSVHSKTDDLEWRTFSEVHFQHLQSCLSFKIYVYTIPSLVWKNYHTLQEVDRGSVMAHFNTDIRGSKL